MFRHLALFVFIAFSFQASWAQQKQKPIIQPTVQKKNLPAIKSSVTPHKSQSDNASVDLEYQRYYTHPKVWGTFPLKVISADENGIPQWFTADIPQEAGKGMDAQITTWLENTRTLLKLDKTTSDFITKNTATTEDGMTHIRMDQLHNGIRVTDGEIVLHEKDGQIFMQNGHSVPSASLPDNVTAELDLEEAKDIIRKDLPGIKKDWNPLSDLDLGKDLKQWTDELVLFNHNDSYKLAYRIEIFAHMGERKVYMVDATDGSILESWSRICHVAGHTHAAGICNHDHDDEEENLHEEMDGQSGQVDNTVAIAGPEVADAVDLLGRTRRINTYEWNGTYFLIDGSRDMFRLGASDMPDEPIGALWTVDVNDSPYNGNIRYSHVTSSNNNWNDRTSVSAHFNAGQAYEYFKNTFGRNSMSGDGQTIVSFINVADENGNSFGQAFYNGAGIWYGNGDNTFFPLGRGLDVAGHELSHGVVQTTAGLEYRNESGAINESFADIFGAMIDRDDWLIGEDVVRTSAFPSGALRSLSDPHNGAAQGDFARGWQPRHYNERYTGPEDNGGVHINSGIPNHAYYLFAQQVGKEVAERVFYRALVSYLTRSSRFTDLRNAVERSAVDLYGQNVANQAGQAFADVGIGSAPSNDYEDDFEINDDGSYLLASDQGLSDLYMFDFTTGESVFNGPFSNTDHISKPSITDDGRRIVFVGSDNQVYMIDVDWSTNPPGLNERVISNEPIWRNAVISRDGSKVALLEVVRNDGDDNYVVVFDFDLNAGNEFALYNPSYTTGVETGDVVFADAMEFDHTGNVLMYDALNSIESSFGNDNIEFWDVGFLTVWNSSLNSWPLVDEVNKLFGSLPENISVGNPTYSKNSPYIIALDVIEENQNGGFNNFILGMNIESYEQDVIHENAYLAYPNFSITDEAMIFDNVDGGTDGIGVIGIQENKISAASQAEGLVDGLRWGNWFSTGTRILSDVAETEADKALLKLSPVPAKDQLHLEWEGAELRAGGIGQLAILDMHGKILNSENVSAIDLRSMDVNIQDLQSGTYILKLVIADKAVSKLFIKH